MMTDYIWKEVLCREDLSPQSFLRLSCVCRLFRDILRRYGRITAALSDEQSTLQRLFTKGFYPNFFLSLPAVTSRVMTLYIKSWIFNTSLRLNLRDPFPSLKKLVTNCTVGKGDISPLFPMNLRKIVFLQAFYGKYVYFPPQLESLHFHHINGDMFNPPRLAACFPENLRRLRIDRLTGFGYITDNKGRAIKKGPVDLEEFVHLVLRVSPHLSTLVLPLEYSSMTLSGFASSVRKSRQQVVYSR